MVSPLIPSPANSVLTELLARLQADLPGLLAGFYVYGSIAYGAFNAAASDIDCLAVTSRACSADELAKLRRIHRELASRWPDADLEISYVQWAHLGPHRADAPPHPLFQTGVFHEQGTTELNSPLWSSILWWQIKRRGIALLGPEPPDLPFDVTPAALLADNRRLAATYWSAWGRSPALIAKLRYPKAVDWAVLGILRTYYTLGEADVTTKAGAGEYGIARLPRRWHPLIRATLDLRQPGSDRDTPLGWRRALGAALFIRYMVAECARIDPGFPHRR